MQRMLIGLMALAIALVGAQGAFARMKDKANYGFCADGTKVPDPGKCPKPKK